MTCSNIGVESCVIPVELDNNVQWLHSYLFPDESYQMTNTVQGLSDTIVSTTGFSEENTTLYNLDKWLETADPEWEATHSTEGGEDTNNQ